LEHDVRSRDGGDRLNGIAEIGGAAASTGHRRSRPSDDKRLDATGGERGDDGAADRSGSEDGVGS
jgi:hypothetical protein